MAVRPPVLKQPDGPVVIETGEAAPMEAAMDRPVCDAVIGWFHGPHLRVALQEPEACSGFGGGCGWAPGGAGAQRGPLVAALGGTRPSTRRRYKRGGSRASPPIQARLLLTLAGLAR